MEDIKPGKYQHYKGNFYEVIGVGKNSESLEEVVIYKALNGDGELWVRPKKMFLEKVEVNGDEIPRFKLIR